MNELSQHLGPTCSRDQNLFSCRHPSSSFLRTPWMRPHGTCCWAVRPFLYIWYKSGVSDSQLVTHRGVTLSMSSSINPLRGYKHWQGAKRLHKINQKHLSIGIGSPAP